MLIPTAEALGLYDKFMANTSFDRIQKILARAELYRMTLDVPGDIVECGVFKGSGIHTWAKLRQIFRPSGSQRIVGFDFFEADRDMEFQHQIDADCLDEHATGWVSRADLMQSLQATGITGTVELVAGNVVETTARWATDNLGARIALLYLDVDNYEGSKAILENLYPMVAPGGLVVLDEYAYPGYGESDAVDEFIRNKKIAVKAIPWANTPTGYFRKECS